MGKTPESGPLVYEEEQEATVVDDNAAQLDGNLDLEISAADLLRLSKNFKQSSTMTKSILMSTKNERLNYWLAYRWSR